MIIGSFVKIPNQPGSKIVINYPDKLYFDPDALINRSSRHNHGLNHYLGKTRFIVAISCTKERNKNFGKLRIMKQEKDDRNHSIQVYQENVAIFFDYLNYTGFTSTQHKKDSDNFKIT